MSSEDFDRWEEERGRRRAEREARRAERRRGRDGEEGSRERPDRKERVLHTRISDTLDDSIRSAAEELRVPVSNLVRNVLEDVFSVVETVADNVGDILDDALGESLHIRQRLRRRARRHGRHRKGRAPEAEEEVEPEPPREVREFPDVVGWQPLILNGEQSCGDCERSLARGDRGFVGLTAAGLSQVYLCSVCMQARR